MTPEIWISSLTLLVGGSLAVWLVAKHTDTIAPALVGFILRLAFAFAAYATLGLSAPDAEYYDQSALALATGADARITEGKEGWPSLLAWIYSTYGHAPHLGLLINCVFGALTVSLVGSLAAQLGTPKRLAAWIWSVFPFSILWGSLLLREAITWFLLVLFTLAIVRVARKSAIWPAAGLAASALTALFLFRGTLAITVGAAGLLAVAILGKHVKSTIVATGILAILVLATPLGSRAINIITSFSLDSINTSRLALGTTASTGWPVIEITDVNSAISTLFIAMPRVLLGPFPWEWPTVGIILAFDALCWLLVAWGIIMGIRQARRSELLIPLLIAAAILGALIVTSGNYGTSQRLRIQATVILVPVVAAGFTRSRSASVTRHNRNDVSDLQPPSAQVNLVELSDTPTRQPRLQLPGHNPRSRPPTRT